MSLYFISNHYAETDPDSAIQYAQETIKFAEKNKNKLPEWMQWNANSVMGWALWSAGNYPDAQAYYFKQLSQAETIKDSFGIYQAYCNLGALNKEEGNYQASIDYYKKGLSFFMNKEEIWWQATVIAKMIDLAKAYAQIDKLDSALYYAQQSAQLNLKTNGVNYTYSTGTIFGIIYSKLRQPSISMDYFRSFLQGAGDNPLEFLNKATCFFEIAKHFERNHQPDSAIFYARKAYQLNETHSFKINILNTSNLLTQLYQNKNQTDSAYKYLKIKTSIQEEMFSKEKLSRMKTLEFNEDLRQKEMELTKQKEDEERNHNIQLSILAISIISAIIIFLLLSQSIIVSHNVVKFLDIVVLLVVFEFVNLLVHPLLEKITGHSPVLMLLALVCMAAVLVPLHHKIENWANATLVEKNKKIRLKAAKRTIEQIEGKS
jgi:tetratricopeptide (TPR) repeat protein